MAGLITLVLLLLGDWEAIGCSVLILFYFDHPLSSPSHAQPVVDITIVW